MIDGNGGTGVSPVQDRRDAGPTSNEPVDPSTGQPQNGGPATPSLERRVRCLEDAVAALQDTRQLETRIADRVADRVNRSQMNALRESAGLAIEAGRRLLPLGAGQSASARDIPGQTSGRPLRQLWLLFDVYDELRAMFRMFVDRRYHLSWTAWIVPLVLVAAILTSWIWVPGTMLLPGFLGTVLDKTVDLMLAFLAYKILSREAGRYREVFPDLSTPLRS